MKITSVWILIFSPDNYRCQISIVDLRLGVNEKGVWLSTGHLVLQNSSIDEEM